MSKYQKLKRMGVYIFKIKEDKKIPAVVICQNKDELFIVPLTKREFQTSDKYYLEINYRGTLTYACVFKLMKVNLNQKRSGRIFELSKYDAFHIEKSIKEMFGV